MALKTKPRNVMYFNLTFSPADITESVTSLMTKATEMALERNKTVYLSLSSPVNGMATLVANIKRDHRFLCGKISPTNAYTDELKTSIIKRIAEMVERRNNR